jgi:hypothetical protein
MGLGEDGRRGGPVTGDVGGLGGDLLQHLGPHVLVGILQLDLLGDGDAVLGDRGAAELLVDDDIAALGPEGRLHGGRQGVDPPEQTGPRFFVELELLRHGLRSSF